MGIHARVITAKNIILRVVFWICLHFMFSYGMKRKSRYLRLILFPAARPQTYWLSFPFLPCRCVQDFSCSCCRVYLQDLLWASLSSKEPFYPMSKNDLQFGKLFLKYSRPVNLIRESQDERGGGRIWRRRFMWQTMCNIFARCDTVHISCIILRLFQN